MRDMPGRVDRASVDEEVETYDMGRSLHGKKLAKIGVD
jgi:hypothetical protein